MIFTDDKKYYKERKTPQSIKKKLEKDISKKKIESFSYEDILKETTLSKKQGSINSKRTNKEEVVDPYDTESVKKVDYSDPLSVYGDDSPFGPSSNLQSGIKKELQKRSSPTIKKTTTLTLEQYVTDRFMKRKKEKESSNTKSSRSKTRQPSQPTFRRKKERQVIRKTVSSDNTIDKVLEGIPYDK